jgi:hypothetical protein
MTPSFPRTALLGVVLAAFPSSRGTADDDEARSPWHFRRSVSLPEGAHPFASLVIPPEVGAGLQADLRDARLIDTRGREIPYVIDRVRDRRAESSWRGALVDMRREPKAQSSWTIDLGGERVFDAIALTVPGQDFSKRLKIETSKDKISWVAREEAGIFDRPWTVRIHHTAISIAAPLDARYLRLTTDDHHSPVIEITGVAVSSSRRLRGETWTREVPLERAPSAGRPSRYRLDLPPGFPAESFELQADDAAFCRRVRIFEVRERNGRREETTLGEGVVYRLRVQDAPLAGEALALQPPGGGELFLEVDNADSPPLENPRGVVSGAGTRLLFPSVDTLFTLYYGNGATRAPLYDLDALKERLATGSAFALAELGPEVPNPRFRPTGALGFVGLTGAPLDVTQWKAERRLTIMGREDLYTLTLSAEDLAYLRDDLADLRIVSDSELQVPYIVDPDAAQERVLLQVESGRGRYHVATPPLPFRALELQFQEGFFSRPFRLRAPDERVLRAGTLSSPAQTVIVLDGQRRDGLLLEIDNGDNTPLGPPRAQGVVQVPRVAFKAGPGTYRLLLGSEGAGPPRYDIVTLRQEILAYSAIVVQAGPAEPNPSFRRRAADYFRNAPPTLLLWGTLFGAVAILILLTLRILRTPPV